MIRLRRATVVEARPAHPGLIDLLVHLDGRTAAAVAYEDLVGEVRAGDSVVLNTTAVTLGLGTGGVHFVVAVEGREQSVGSGGHAMKLRYTPSQVAVDAVEESHAEVIDALESLEGLPVVCAGLHSALAAVAIGARDVEPRRRVVYVMTDGGALHLGFSRTVPALRSSGLLDATITCGQATGGEYEAVNLYSALAAARAVCRADVVVVAIGPGNLGTGTRLGFALLETAAAINAVAALGGRAIAVPRLSFADPRGRHQGVSHHTLTALALTLASAEIALPPLPPELARVVRPPLEGLGRHRVHDVALGEQVEEALASNALLRSMGRTFAEDPHPFRVAAAAGVHAARLSSSS